jgi:predicted small lipoprotein YifL
LQVDHNLAAIGEDQCDHGADALIVYIGQILIVDPVTAGLDRTKKTFSEIEKFRVGHYNFTMLRCYQILVSTLVLALGVATLSACGQQGPLYLPGAPDPAKSPAAPERTTSGPQNPVPAPTTP